MSFKSVAFESLGAVSYSPSMVTMALSCIICEIERDVVSYPLAFDASVRGRRSSSEYCHPVWCGKTRMVELPDSEKISSICITV